MSAASGPEPIELELRDYVRVLRRRWGLILLITALALGFGLANSLRHTPVYEGRALVLLDAGFSQTILFAQDNTAIPNIDEQVITETDLMQSGPVQQSIAKLQGYQPDVRISSLRPADDNTSTRLISVIASDSSKKRAAQEASDFAEAYVNVRKELISEDLRTSIAQNNKALIQLDELTAATRKRITALGFMIPDATGDARLLLEAERDRLSLQVEDGDIDSRQLQIQSRISLLQTALANNETRGIFKLSPAPVPQTPISPTPKRDGLIALAIGLGLAIAAAFLRDYYDDTIRTKDDLDRVTGGIAILSIIPAVTGWRRRSKPLLESVEHPYSATSEAYRSMRTSIDFAAIEHKIGIIHVTSSTSGEGKTTTAANLAVTLAGAGKRVVLVDCDLRRPRLHQFFDMENTTGFTSVLVGEVDMLEALQEVDGVTGLTVLPSGPRPPNPSELLGTKAAHNLLKKLAELADTVILDSPPLLPVADSSILAGYAHASVLVVAARSTTRRLLARSLEVLAQANAPLEGIVLNNVSEEATYGYSYSYGYNEADLEPDSFWARALRRGREG